MPRLRDALKHKFKSPQEALRALGLDETLIEQEQKMQNVLLSRKAAVAKGALMAVLRPVLAADANLNLNAALKHLTAKNFADEKGGIAKAIHNVASKKLAKDKTLALDSITQAMDVAEKDDEPEDKDEKEKEGKDGMMPGKTALDSLRMKKGYDAEGFKKMLKEKMSEDDYKAACDMMAAKDDKDDDDEDEDEDRDYDRTEEEKETDERSKSRRAREEAEEGKDKKAKDARMKAKDATSVESGEKITKGAMDAALEEHGRKIRETERGIRVALDQVRPIVGEIKADIAFDSATDVHRHAAMALEIKGAKTMHPEALWPVIEAHARLRDRPAHKREDEALGFDEASIVEAVKIAPGLARIRHL